MDRVAAEAQRSCVRTSVVIPARNEAATIGDIVTAIRALPATLVHELVVVDSDSADETARVAAAAGARVLTLTDVLPDIRPRVGKGEAMWRGVAATTGDIVVFVDADLTAFDPHIIAALVGPLLADASLELIKGAFERWPSDPLRPRDGGGRVTELVARPLLNALWPELAFVAQPLGGEYSIRRSLVEQLPFRCGYGVELGLLVDTLRHVGPRAIGQVHLGVRTHRNSDLTRLGSMAAEILHTALDRLSSEGRAALPEVSGLLVQPDGSASGDRHRVTEVDTSERPALVTLRGARAG